MMTRNRRRDMERTEPGSIAELRVPIAERRRPRCAECREVMVGPHVQVLIGEAAVVMCEECAEARKEMERCSR